AGGRGAGSGRCRGAPVLRGSTGAPPGHRAIGPDAGACRAGALAGGDPRRLTLAKIRVASAPNSRYSRSGNPPDGAVVRVVAARVAAIQGGAFAMWTVAFPNKKGGVGKTSACHHLSGAMAQKGLRALLVDADPQASLSQGLLGSGSSWRR